MSKEFEDVIVEPIVEEEIEPEVEVVEAVQTFVGKVVDCTQLNIRCGANKNAKVLCVIRRNEEMEVSIDESTDHFYKVYLKNGIEGFAMKQFIEVE